MQAKFEAAKRAKAAQAAQDAAAKYQEQYSGAEGAVTAAAETSESDALVAANAGWRRGGASQPTRSKEEERQELATAFEVAVSSERTFSSDKYSSKAISFGEREKSLSGSQSIQYLHVGEPAPLEVWNELVDVHGEPASFWGDGERAKPLVVVVSHFQESSVKLKSAVETLNKKLPRKAFPADVKVVARCSAGAMRKLAKASTNPGVEFYSAGGATGDAWCWSHGITPQLNEFGVSVFVIEATSGVLFAVSYDCDPLEVVAFTKRAIAAYVDRQ